MKKYVNIVVVLLLVSVCALAQTIHQAVYQEDLARVKSILEADPEQVNAAGANGMTPLIFAVYKNNIEISEYLISKGGDVNLATPGGSNPIILAVSMGDEKILDLLVKKGADIEVKFEGRSLLQQAAMSANEAAINYLLSIKFPLDAKSVSGAELLHVAASNGYQKLLGELLKQGADIYSLNPGNGTLLHSAASGNNTALVKEMIAKKFQINRPDAFGQTPLHYAVKAEHTELAELLLNAGADVNTVDSDMRTPLMIAEDHFNTGLTELLIKNRAEIKERESVFIGTSAKVKNVEKQCEITQVANVGFLIKTPTKKILIDALTLEYVGTYFSTAVIAKEKMVKGLPPFDNLNLYLQTHNHGDHFDEKQVAQFMLKNKKCRYVAPKAVITMLEKEPDYNLFADRVEIMTPEYEKFEEREINGIKVKAYRAQHDDRPAIENIAYLFEADGIRFFHTGDFSGAAMEKHSGYHWEQEKINVAFLGSYFFWEKERTDLMHKYINPEHVVVTHVQKQNQINVKKQHLDNPETTVFDELLHKRIFQIK